MMSERDDFERAWLEKFSKGLDAIAGVEVRCHVMAGSEESLFASSRQAVIDWTRGAMQRVDQQVDEVGRRQVLLGCACHYPWEEITGRPVHVELLESVLAGGEVCKVAIHLSGA
jgi:hypothetical protein